MSFLIQDALADGAPAAAAAAGNGFASLIPLVLLFVVFYSYSFAPKTSA